MQTPPETPDALAPWKNIGLSNSWVQQLDTLFRNIHSAYDSIRLFDEFRQHPLGLTIAHLRLMENKYHFGRGVINMARRRLVYIMPMAEARGAVFKNSVSNRISSLHVIAEELRVRATLDQKAVQERGYDNIDMFRKDSDPPADIEDRAERALEQVSLPIFWKLRKASRAVALVTIILLVAVIAFDIMYDTNWRNSMLPTSLVNFAWATLDWQAINLLASVAITASIPLALTGTEGDLRELVLTSFVAILNYTFMTQVLAGLITFINTESHDMLVEAAAAAVLTLLDWIMMILGWVVVGWAMGSAAWYVDAFWYTMPLYPTLVICAVVLEGLKIAGGLVMAICAISYLGYL